MASTDITTADVAGDDSGLTDRQVKALQELYEAGGEPRETPDAPYSGDPRIRALQLISEGRLGGPNRGQGRRKKKRAAETVADHVRERLAPKISRTLDEAMDDENGNIRLKAVDLAMRIERDETKLQLEEERDEIDQLSKEEIVDSLIALAQEPTGKAALSSAFGLGPQEIIEDAEVIDDEGEGQAEAPQEAQQRADIKTSGATNPVRASSTASAKKNRVNRRSPRSNGRGNGKADSAKGPSTLAQAARRRAAK